MHDETAAARLAARLRRAVPARAQRRDARAAQPAHASRGVPRRRRPGHGPAARPQLQRQDRGLPRRSCARSPTSTCSGSRSTATTPEALGYIRRQSPHPISSCETLLGLREFLPYFRAQAMDVAIIDAVWNGVWQSMKIASRRRGARGQRRAA